MLPNLTCPDVFDSNGPNVLSQIKVHSPPMHMLAMQRYRCGRQARLPLAIIDVQTL